MAIEFARSSQDSVAWDNLIQILDEECRLTDSETVSGSLDEDLWAIDADCDMPTEDAADPPLSALHVEPLLDQAVDLLDRGIRERLAFDDLMARWVTLLLELKEYRQLDGVLKKEQEAHIYSIALFESEAALNAESTLADGAKKAAEMMTENLGYYDISGKWSVLIDGASQAARASALLGQVQVEKMPPKFEVNDHDFGPRFRALGINTVALLQGYVATEATQHAMTSQGSALAVQAKIQQVASNASAARAVGLTAKSEWDKNNVAFRTERTTILRNLLDIKLKAALEPAGPLNYRPRLRASRKRFKQDFRNAMKRLMKVRVGIEVLYGYKVDLPSTSGTRAYYDDCLLWARDAIDFLIRRSRQEQMAIVPLSLRKLIGDAKWQQGLIGGHWVLEAQKEVFGSKKGLRLRGLAAVVTTSDPRSIWQIGIQPPREARFDGTQFGPPPPLPRYYIGRVANRDAIRDPDIVGGAALYNASPVGTWTITAESVLPVGTRFDTLSDIQLDLHLAFV